jgi:hypothetical protein
MVPRTLPEAWKHVNERYIFDSQNYPILGKKLTKRERKVFAVNHNLLHLIKSKGGLRNAFENTGELMTVFDTFDKTDFTLSLRAALVKTVVNVIKLAETLEMTNEEFAAIQPKLVAVNEGKDWAFAYELLVASLAKECEAADHGKEFDEDELKRQLTSFWAGFLGWFNSNGVPVPYTLIPDYMKSK